MLININTNRWFLPWFIENYSMAYEKYLKEDNPKWYLMSTTDRRKNFTNWYGKYSGKLAFVKDDKIMLDFPEEEITWNTLRY